jgi:hypothetical protein
LLNVRWEVELRDEEHEMLLVLLELHVGVEDSHPLGEILVPLASYIVQHEHPPDEDAHEAHEE